MLLNLILHLDMTWTRVQVRLRGREEGMEPSARNQGNLPVEGGMTTTVITEGLKETPKRDRVVTTLQTAKRESMVMTTQVQVEAILERMTVVNR